MKFGRKTRRKLESVIDELHPAQRAGLEINGEAVGDSPSSSVTTSDLIAHMKDADVERGNTAAKFVAEDDPSEYWSLGDDRVVAGADVTFTKATMQAIETGHTCLRCMEFHDVAFPVACSLCGYSMQELQLRDVALEIKGFKHLGPSEPISHYMEEQQEEMLRRKFANKLKTGGSRMTGLRRNR